MTLVTAERYAYLTGDQTSDNVEAALERAQKAVEEYLQRPVEYGEYTESVRVYANGRAYPLATPIDPDANPDLNVTEDLLAVTLAHAGAMVRLTYFGGWSEQDVPLAIEEAIVQTAHSRLNPNETEAEVPEGATHARVGDTAVSFRQPFTSRTDLSSGVASSIRKWKVKRA